MKLRVRTVDGGTLKVDVDKAVSVLSFISQLNLPPSLEASRQDFCLSLNKKDVLNPDTTLEANGIRGGDLVHLVSRTGVGAPAGNSLSRPQTSSAAAAASPSELAGAPGPFQVAETTATTRSSLFGLPTAAPTSDATSAPGTVDPEQARQQRLNAIARRLGTTLDPAALGTQKRERPEGDSARAQAIGGRCKQAPKLHDMLRSLQQKHGLGPLAPADACVLGLHCCITKAGYLTSQGEDTFLASRAWKGKNGSYSLSYLAQVDGVQAELALKCVEMGQEIIVHASLGQGHSIRSSMRCSVSHVVTTKRMGAEPDLVEEGEPLFHTVRTKLLGALERQGVGPPRDSTPAAHNAVSNVGSGNRGEVDTEMGEIGTVGAPGFPGLVDQAQTFAVFREGLRVAKLLPHVEAAIMCEGSFLFLSVHVVLCCAGLAPEAETPTPELPCSTASAAHTGAGINPEWELVEAGMGEADYEIIDKESAADNTTCTWSLPQALTASIKSLPDCWLRAAAGGSHCVRYHASVEGGSAAVLLKSIHLNGRVFLHARVVGPSNGSVPLCSAPTARCALVESEMVAKIGGECVLTDAALEKLIVMVSRRLLVPIGRAVRACAPLIGSREGSQEGSPEHDEKGDIMSVVAPTHSIPSSSERRGRVSFGALYAELKTHILAHLPGRVLGVVACASRKLNSLAMNDLLWGFLVVRDFDKKFSGAPLSVKEGGDLTWRGSYRALLQKRQQRRTAVRQLFRIPFPLNPLAPWLPQNPGQARQPFNDPRFPMPWMVPVPLPWGSGTGSWGMGGNALPIDHGPLSDGLRTYSVARAVAAGVPANLASERDTLRTRGGTPRDAHTHAAAAEAASVLPSPPRPTRPNSLLGAARGSGTGGFLGGGFRGF